MNQPLHQHQKRKGRSLWGRLLENLHGEITLSTDELRILFEDPPSPRTLRVSQVVKNTFRYLGPITSAEVFYVFARLDPYEQAALIESSNSTENSSPSSSESSAAKGQRIGETPTRPRRTIPR